MNVGLGEYIRAAFNARPMGMFVPPNWVGLGVFGLLGILNPGFWIVGLGLELGYLYVLSTHPRFQRLVHGLHLTQAQREGQSKVNAAVAALKDEDRKKYRALELRCQSILEQQSTLESSPDIQGQRDGLGRLLWIYLRLLFTRDSIRKILPPLAGPRSEREPLERRIHELEGQLAQTSLNDDLRKSLSSQLEILQQRLQSHHEATAKLGVVEAELTRIEEQVELIREQAMLAADPAVVSQRIDQIAATLGGTTQWIKEQQQIYGKVGDLLEEPPPIPLQSTAKEGMKQ